MYLHPTRFLCEAMGSGLYAYVVDHFVVCLLAFAVVNANHRTWYIGQSSNVNTSTCGADPSTACERLEDILGDAPSLGDCFQPTNSTAGTDSTTFIFLENYYFSSQKICFDGWKSLRMGGSPTSFMLPPSPSTKRVRGVITLRNCDDAIVERVAFDDIPYALAGIHIASCSNLSLRSSSFVVSLEDNLGVLLQDAMQTTAITNCTFSGSPVPSRVQGILATLTGNATKNSSLLISDCIFSGINARTILSPYSYRDSSEFASAVEVSVGDTSGLKVVVLRSNFTNVSSNVGSTLLMRFDSRSYESEFSIESCTFYNNSAAYGGGLGVYFWAGSARNRVDVSNTDFEANTAAFEGGAMFAGFFTKEPNTSTITVTEASIQSNTASYGAAMFVATYPFLMESVDDILQLLNPPLGNLVIVNCIFNHNKLLSTIPSESFGIVLISRIDAQFSGNNTFENNTGSVLGAESSVMRIRDHITFIGNSANSGTCINLISGSKLDMVGVTKARFISNRATTGGAVAADRTSASPSFLEHRHTDSSTIQGQCFIKFPSLHSVEEPIFLFDNNSASYGSTHTVSSFGSCDLSYFVLRNVSRLVSIFPDNSVVEYRNTPFQSGVATSVSYIVFYGASTKCLKRITNMTYLLPNCSHQLLSNTFSSHPDLHCGLSKQIGMFPLVQGKGLHITLDQLLYPWAGVDESSEQFAGETDSCPEANIADLVLSPASGEEFDLTVQMFDQLLNIAVDTATLTLVPDNPSIPLYLQFSGIQFSTGDFITFAPSRPLSGIAVVGPVGSTGQLQISALSHILFQHVLLSIKVEISPCPLGFLPPATTQVPAFKHTDRIPNGNPLACGCVFDGILANSISCVRGYFARIPDSVWLGYSDGYRNPYQVPCPTAEDKRPIADSTTSWVAWNMEYRSRERAAGAVFPVVTLDIFLSPDDVVTYEGNAVPGGGAPVMCYSTTDLDAVLAVNVSRESVIENCPNGYCERTPSGFWITSDVSSPCVDTREGVLCGKCKPGYAVTPQSNGCTRCEGSNPAPVIILQLLFGLLIVLIALVFNIGSLPAVDIMLFYLQAAIVLFSGHPVFQSFQYLAVYFDFSFSLCFSSNFNALHKQAWQYFSPVYIMLLLVMLLILARFKRCATMIGGRSVLSGFWLLLLISYSNLSLTSFSILQCTELPTEGSSVMFVDGSIPCFQGGHIALAVVAILVLALLVIPFPVILTVILYVPKWKPFTDVYKHIFRERLHWWIFIDLARRIVVNIFGVFIQVATIRQYVLLATFLILAVLYGSVNPYPKHIDNILELLSIVTLAGLTSLTLLDTRGVGTVIVLFVSWFMTFIIVSFSFVLIFPFVWKKVSAFIEKKSGKKLPMCHLLKVMKRLFNKESESLNSNNDKSKEDDVDILDFTRYRIPSDHESSVVVNKGKNDGPVSDSILSSVEMVTKSEWSTD